MNHIHIQTLCWSGEIDRTQNIGTGVAKVFYWLYVYTLNSLNIFLVGFSTLFSMLLFLLFSV